MRIYITGIKGTLGRSIVADFGRRNDVNIVNESEVDILDYEELKRDVEKYNPEVLIHAAAIVGSTSCDVFGEYAVRINCEGAYNVALLCKRMGIKLVHFSSTAIYNCDGVINENSLKEPLTLYGATKLASEAIARAVYGEKILIVRPSFIYSPHDNNDHQKSIKMLIASHFNHDVASVLLLNPEYKKTYTHVDDFCEFLFRLIEKNCSGDYNVSCGVQNAVSLRRIIVTLSLLGIDSRVYFRKSEDYMRNHLVSNKKVVATTKYSAKYRILNKLGEMIEEVKKSVKNK